MDTTPSAAAPRVPGYDLGERLGAGATSVVWRALRCADGAPVAVKVVQVWDRAEGAVREAGLLRRLRVEGLVRVHDALTLPDDPTAVALVLDLLEGGSLVSVLAARGHLSAGEAVTVVAPVARALAGLHALGVVHADVSPANVLFERSGRPVLADLGVSRLAGEAPGETFGTDGFTAPEVEAGEQPSTASDVYAVGALAWACVSGAPPGPMGARRPLSELAPGLPQPWTEVVADCLAPFPADRPSAAEAALRLFDAVPCEPLRLVAGEDEVSLLTRRIRSAPPPEEPTPQPSRRERCGRRLREARAAVGRVGRVGRRTARSRRIALVLGLCLLAGLSTVLSAVVWRPARSGPADAAPTSIAWPREGAVRPPSPRRPTTGATTPPRSAAVASTTEPVRQDRLAPRRDPEGLMRALADARAVVLMAREDDRLADLDVHGSPAWDADRRVLTQLRQRGERYAGLSFVVRSARHVSGDDTTAALRVRVDTAAYRVVGPDGTQVSRPAEPAPELVVRLRWSQGRWLVEEVTAAGV